MKNSFCFSFMLIAVLFFTVPNGLSGQQEWLCTGDDNLSSFPNDRNTAVAVDENGAIYTTGVSHNYDANSGQILGKIPLKKFTPYGKRLYSKHHDIQATNSSNLDEWANDIAATALYDRVIIGGSKTIFGYPFLAFYAASSGSFINEVPFGNCSGAVSKIDIKGNEVWAIGNFGGTISFGGGFSYTGNPSPTSNVFVAKFNATTGAIMSAFFLSGSNISPRDIKVDAYNNIYFTAKTNGIVQFIGIPNSYFPAVIGQTEAFLCKVTANNTLAFAVPIAPAALGVADFFPIGIAYGDESTIVAVGGLDNSTQNSYIQTRNAANGVLLKQSPLFNNKVINDLAVSNCGSSKIMAVGHEKLPNSTNPGLGFMFEFQISNFTNGGLYYYTTNPANIRAIALENNAGHPAIAGDTPSYISGFQFRGASVTQNNYSHEFIGKFKANNFCCPNRGLRMDGVDDFLEGFVCPSMASFTFEAWVYSTATNTGNCSGQFRRLLGWGYSGKNQIEIGECSGNLVINDYKSALGGSMLLQWTSSQTLRGKWWHLAVTRSGNSVTAYVNGILVPLTGTFLGNVNLPQNKFYIGRGIASMNGTENWQGLIDEVRLWNYVRPLSAIQNKSLCALKGNESNLVLYYPLDHGIPSSANSGVTTEWNHTALTVNTPYFSNLRNFSLSGGLSNWVCSSVAINGICAPLKSEVVGARTETTELDETLPEDPNGFSIYPNPNNGMFNVQLSKPATSDMSFRIISISGQVLRAQIGVADVSSQEIEARDLPAGFYFLQVLSEGMLVGVKKFVKQ